MLTEIKLYGHLKEITGSSSFKAKVSNTAEAVRFLISNFPTLEQEMANQYYRVSVNNLDIDKTELYDPIGISEIKIIPVVAGSGRGFGKILLGAALIGLSFISFGGAPGLGAAFKGGFTAAKFAEVGLISKSLAYVGASLVLSGVADLFTPQVSPEAEDPLSASFSNTVNTTLATVPLPIVYGEYIVGSVVISGAIETADGSPSTSGSQVAQDHRGAQTAIPIDPSTELPVEEYDRTNTDTSLRRYVRVYSENSNKIKIEAVVGNNTYTGTGYTNTGGELLTSYQVQNKNQFNYSAFVRNGRTKYFPGNLKETIGTELEEGRPGTNTGDGYYYGLVTGDSV
jgi:predicted phage tail protein